MDNHSTRLIEEEKDLKHLHLDATTKLALTLVLAFEIYLEDTNAPFSYKLFKETMLQLRS